MGTLLQVPTLLPSWPRPQAPDLWLWQVGALFRGFWAPWQGRRGLKGNGAMWSMRPVWLRDLGPGAPTSWKGPQALCCSQQGRAQVSTTQHRLRPPGSGRTASAPAVPSASSQPIEGPLFWLPAVPAGRLGTGPTAFTLSRGLLPSGTAILGWPGGPWHPGPVQEAVSQDTCRGGESVQSAHSQCGRGAWRPSLYTEGT